MLLSTVELRIIYLMWLSNTSLKVEKRARNVLRISMEFLIYGVRFTVHYDVSYPEWLEIWCF